MTKDVPTQPRIVVLQHSAHDDLGAAAPWFARRGLAPRIVQHWRGDPLPAASSIDGLVALGGAAAAYDAHRIDWLAAEMRLLEAALRAGLPVLGLCLGAQMIAQALGARVAQAAERERGWFEVTPRHPAAADALGLDEPTALFHWHGDAFELPAGARRLASSAACANQAFDLGPRVLALQFHAEITPQKARAFVERTHAQAPTGRWIEAADAILATPAERYARSGRLMARALDGVFGAAA